jgi:hypothetical protein
MLLLNKGLVDLPQEDLQAAQEDPLKLKAICLAD